MELISYRRGQTVNSPPNKEKNLDGGKSSEEEPWGVTGGSREALSEEPPLCADVTVRKETLIASITSLRGSLRAF